MTNSAFARLKESVGPSGFSEDPEEIAPHLAEWRSRYEGRSTLLLKPDTTDAVSRILAICAETQTPIVPQGGNTGLVGGQIPFSGEVLLSMSRLNRVRALDAQNRTLIAEAGVILAEVHRRAEDADLMFPLSLASEGSCTVGGNVSTNAGGIHVLRYGMMRDMVLGLEVVLADGRPLHLTDRPRKDNTGYDLKQLFIGAEGTLGVVTAVELKLFPVPVERETAFVAVPSPAESMKLLSSVQQRTGGLTQAFELLSRTALELVLSNFKDLRNPLGATSDWYVLIEVAGDRPLRDLLETSIEQAIAGGLASDGVLAGNEKQRAELWALRERVSEAQKRDGASIKHDISLPARSLPEFLARATAEVLKLVPGARPVTFGHLGDGNIHFNFSAPIGASAEAFLAKWEDVQRRVHDIVHTYGGSFSAEHGIGVMKRKDLLRYKSEAEIDVMRAIKRALDPRGILNPGKILTAQP